MEMTKEELIDLVNGFTSKLEEYKKAVDELKTSIYDDFINPAAEEYKRFDHDTRLGEFKEKYKDLLEPLVGPCKAAEQNPDFDVYDQIFKDYDENTDENKMEEGEYVAQAVAAITEQIEALKASLGADKVEVKNEEGETVVEADGEKVAEAETETKEEEKVEEPSDEEDPFEKEVEEALKNESRFSLK
jgi:hypothetical protein